MAGVNTALRFIALDKCQNYTNNGRKQNQQAHSICHISDKNIVFHFGIGRIDHIRRRIIALYIIALCIIVCRMIGRRIIEAVVFDSLTLVLHSRIISQTSFRMGQYFKRLSDGFETLRIFLNIRIGNQFAVSLANNVNIRILRDTQDFV